MDMINSTYCLNHVHHTMSNLEKRKMELACASNRSTYSAPILLSPLKYDGYTYRTVKHSYQCTKARDAGYTIMAEDMRAMRNPYQVKKLGSDLPIGKKWKQQSEELMKDLIQAKFDQNENLKEKLLDVPYLNFYEMTGDKLWAIG